MKRKFFIKNLFSFLTPMLIPILALGLVTGVLLNKYMKSEIDKRNMDKFANYATNIDAMMNELERLNINLSSNPSVRLRLKSVISKLDNGLSAEDYEETNTIIDLLYSSANFNSNVASLYVYFNNNENWFVSSTNRISNLDFFYDTSWYDSFRNHLATQEPYWGEFREIHDFLFQKGRDIKVFTLFNKIYSSGKAEPDGVLVLNIMAEQMDSVLDKLVENEHEIFFIADIHNQIIFKNNQEKKSKLSQNSPVPFKGKNIRSIDSIAKEGIHYQIYSFGSSLYDWNYVYMIPQDIVFAMPDLLTKLTVGIIFIVVLLGTLLCYKFASKNYQDILSLVSILENAKQGNDLPADSQSSLGLFNYILQHVLRSFVQIDYLQVQLSEKKYYLKTLELLALQSQLNPHFLFNTMQMIYWKTIALTGEPNEASCMIENLSDLLHYSLDDSEKMVPLFEEVRITNCYLEIQKSRNKDLFEVSWGLNNIDPDIPIAKLILQPLVENAITHGLQGKHTKSYIKILLKQYESHLKITVIDNGIGIKKDRLREINRLLHSSGKTVSEHIGLFNTNKRLQLIYGTGYSLYIRSKENKGTCLTLILPNSTELKD